MSTDTIRTLQTRVSHRHYSDEDIAEDTLKTLLNAARRSPTSSNMQAYSLVVVRDQQTKATLAQYAGGQRHVAECPVFIAICADIYRLKLACEMHGTTLAQNTENTLVSSVDAALVGMSLSLAADSMGIGNVMIGGIRNHPLETAELLGLPDGVYVVFGMCLGYPAKERQPKPRLPESLVIHYERYSTNKVEEQLRQHDDELATHYRSVGANTPDAAWTGVMADKFSEPKRDQLRQQLETLGFSFD